MIKENRIRLAKNLCKTEEVHTIDEMQKLLKKSGVKMSKQQVTQLLTDARIKKQLNEAGEYVYREIPFSVKNMREYVRSASLSGMIEKVDVAGTMVAVHTLDAWAMAVATILDDLKDPDIIATVAGFNTVMIMTKDVDTARRVCEKTRSLMYQ